MKIITWLWDTSIDILQEMICMKLKHPGKRLMSLVLTSALALGVLPTLPASADWHHIGCMGDLDRDQHVTLTDLVRLTKHILAVESLTTEQLYDVKGKLIGINGADGFLADDYLTTADINEDGDVDVYDLALLKRYDQGHDLGGTGWIAPRIHIAGINHHTSGGVHHHRRPGG